MLSLYCFGDVYLDQSFDLFILILWSQLLFLTPVAGNPLLREQLKGQGWKRAWALILTLMP